MAKRNPANEKAKTTASAAAELPTYLRGYDGPSETENWGPEDIPWCGEDGTPEPDRLLAECGFDPLSPLEYLLLAIIDANPPGHPNSNWNRNVRLEKAMAALVGTGRRTRGMDPKDDYELLLQMGWRYHCLFWNNGGKPPEKPLDIKSIAAECIARLPSDDPRRLATDDSVISRLRRKFKKDKDLYIIRATEQRAFERMDTLQEIKAIIEKLKASGR